MILLTLISIKTFSSGDNPTAPKNTPQSPNKPKKGSYESNDTKIDDEKINLKNKEESHNTEGYKESHKNHNKYKSYYFGNSNEPKFYESNTKASYYESNKGPRNFRNTEEFVNSEINEEPCNFRNTKGNIDSNINAESQSKNIPMDNSSIPDGDNNTREIPTDLRNDNTHSSAYNLSTSDFTSDDCNNVEDSSSENYINAEEFIATNTSPQTSENSENLNSAQEAQSNSTFDGIPQCDSLPSFKNTFDDSEIEDSSSSINQRRSFKNFKDKINYLRQEINSRYRVFSNVSFPININRKTILEESFPIILNSTSYSLRKKPRVFFNNERGFDVGGLTKEWLELVIKNALNPELGYFSYTNEKNTTIRPYIYSGININHLEFFKFVGRLLGMTIINNYNVGAYFDKSVFKSILKKKCTLLDLEEVDLVYYNSLVTIKNTPVADLGIDLTFDHEIQELGVIKTIDLIPNGRDIVVTDENKNQYVELKAQMMLHGVIKSQLKSLRDGLYEIIDPDLISIFTESELELLICGNPIIDVEDWKKNTIYLGYNNESNMILWFWRVVEEFTQSERAKLLQFATGSSKVPFEGFANLKSNGWDANFTINKMKNVDSTHLPKSHTCFNQIDIPEYPTYEHMKEKILLAINEGCDGFALA